jgi:hypothetical protein
VLVIRVAAAEVYDRALQLPSGERRWEGVFLAALVAFIALLAVGVFRRWRWTFWLITVAFLSGMLRVPVVILQLMGFLAADTPTRYLLFQGSSVWSSSRLGWPWWPATAGPASGEPSRVAVHETITRYGSEPVFTRRQHSPGRSDDVRRNVQRGQQHAGWASRSRRGRR